MDISVQITQDFRFSEDVLRGMANGDVMHTAIGFANMGRPVLPIDPNTKKPIFSVVPRGVRDAASESVAVYEMFNSLSGNVGLGVVPYPDYAVVDDDSGGNLDTSDYGITGTFTEQTRRGAHHWVALNPERTLARKRLPGGDLIGGVNSYVAVTPTPHYSVVDVDAPIILLPDTSILYEIDAPEQRNITDAVMSTTDLSTLPTHELTAEDREAAEWVMRKMKASTSFARQHAALLTAGADWASLIPHARDTSESARDFWTVYSASHFLRDNPRRHETLICLLLITSSKMHPDPDHYRSLTVLNACDERDRVDQQQQAHFTEHYVIPHLPTALKTKTNVFDVTNSKIPRPGKLIDEVIVGFAKHDVFDEYTREAGFRRLPVDMLARVFSVTRKTVWERLVRVEESGAIERDPIAYEHDGDWQRDSRLRARTHQHYVFDGDRMRSTPAGLATSPGPVANDVADAREISDKGWHHICADCEQVHPITMWENCTACEKPHLPCAPCA